MFGLVKGRGDDHALFGDSVESDVPCYVRAELVGVGIFAGEMTSRAVVGERHLHFADFPVAVALFACRGHIELAHGKQAHRRIGELRGSDKVHDCERQCADVAHVADCQTKRKLVVGDIVVIPLFKACFLAFTFSRL